jgi:hypothetical protein
VATAELSGSILASLMALVAPAAAIFLVLGVVGITVVKVRKKRALKPNGNLAHPATLQTQPPSRPHVLPSNG